MFVTTSSYSYPMPQLPGLTLADQYWRAVEISNPVPWFLMTICQRESVGKKRNATFSTRNILLMEVEEVERLASHDSKHPIQFESALIVTPPCINLSAAWRMETLVAIWTADEPSLPGASVEICEAESGHKYVTSPNQVPLDELKNVALRFKFPVRCSR